MKPLIGISTNFMKDKGFVTTTLSQDYSNAVLQAGGIPMPLPAFYDDSYIDEIFLNIKGLLVSGGYDIDPKKYGESVKKNLGIVTPERDDFELKLIEKALQKNIPILGICRGLQIINVFFGGNLYQDLPSEVDSKQLHAFPDGGRDFLSHKVKICDEKIEKIFQGKEFYVNTFHHQAIKNLGKDLLPMAYSDDGLIEGIYSPKYKFLVAVQWHPETFFTKCVHQTSLFNEFVSSCK